MAELPSGTVTFLFTDLEGSTRPAGRSYPHAMQAALARHEEIVRDAIEGSRRVRGEDEQVTAPRCVRDRA